MNPGPGHYCSMLCRLKLEKVTGNDQSINCCWRIANFGADIDREGNAPSSRVFFYVDNDPTIFNDHSVS